MKKIATALLMLISFNAMAAQAQLLSCDPSTSVTGRFIYVGTYNYNGQIFQRTFTNWCPYTIEVY